MYILQCSEIQSYTANWSTRIYVRFQHIVSVPTKNLEISVHTKTVFNCRMGQLPSRNVEEEYNFFIIKGASPRCHIKQHLTNSMEMFHTLLNLGECLKNNRSATQVHQQLLSFAFDSTVFFQQRGKWCNYYIGLELMLLWHLLSIKALGIFL